MNYDISKLIGIAEVIFSARRNMETTFFENGATWIRADFHLHTNADKEFSYSGEDNFYNSNYVDALSAAGIRVGVITNHNKFDFEEFKALKKMAKKRDIFLLPGVELSVNDGANGIHSLMVFSDDWIANGDRISPFLSTMFPGKTPEEYQNENAVGDKNILQTVEELDKTGLDYFFVFAHVEDPKGLWCEMGGGKLQGWREARYHVVKKLTLGFQKVRTRDERTKVKTWFGDWYPAEVEGSDPKTIDEIGKGKPCYLKLGAFTFDAVKFALADHENRLREAPMEISHSYIRSIEFTGGMLNERSVSFSPELNTLIGIRGSGKSSILEALRYALDISVDHNDADRNYKENLVERTLGSGGKITLNVLDQYRQPCQIRRIWRESAQVFYDDKLQPGVSIRETVLRKPLFFGQKELASAGKGAERDLIEKLLGTKCDDIRRQIAEQQIRVIEAIDSLSKTHSVAEQITEQTKIKQDTEFRLEFYRKHHLEEKLQKRLAFEADIKKAKAGVALSEAFAVDIRALLARHEDELRNFSGYSSPINAEFFKDFDAQFARLIQCVDCLKAELAKAESTRDGLAAQCERLVASKQGLAEEFAAIERTLAEELKTTNGKSISSDEFLALKRQDAAAIAALAALERGNSQKVFLQNALLEELQKLNELWHNEFLIIKRELDTVSQRNTALKFTVDYKGDRTAFLDYFKSIFRGSGVRDVTFQNIADQYQSFSEIYTKFKEAQALFGSNPNAFADWFMNNLKELLVYQTPNHFTIFYRNVELLHHSLGQRASALILFVLGQRENDVIVIDQPEDDLDNQTIYEDVIKLLRELKPHVQFIFATHNPNIPVLGDAEQVLACSVKDEGITVQSGGLDDPAQQSRIVNIMEGGKEAFDKRKEIYQIWKP